MSTANILATLKRATASEIDHGASWYPMANAIASECPAGTEAGAGIIAALSPMMPWERNVMLARRTFEAGTLDGGALTSNVLKANRIMAGESPLDVLGGDKVRSFFTNIVDPMGDNVTVDRHAHDIAMGRFYTDKERRIGKRVYREIADEYREVADMVGIPVPGTQAITWVTWRRVKGVK